MIGKVHNFSLVAWFPRWRIPREDNDFVHSVAHLVHGLIEADREG